VSIEIPARAQADIDIASEELADNYGPAVALAFQQRLAETLRRLERQPLSAGLVDPPYPKHPDLRARTVIKFAGRLVYYVATPTGIRVIRVLHSGMDADTIFG
jgi:plasmid stabilization system protein ParE